VEAADQTNVCKQRTYQTAPNIGTNDHKQKTYQTAPNIGTNDRKQRTYQTAPNIGTNDRKTNMGTVHIPKSTKYGNAVTNKYITSKTDRKGSIYPHWPHGLKEQFSNEQDRHQSN